MSAEGDQGSAVDTTYQILRERIIAGSYQPGLAFSQVQLARELDVSRTPLREALQRLEAEGLVVGQANRGVVVAPIELSDLENSYALRLLVEPAVVSAILGRVTAEDIGQMRQALIGMNTPNVSSRDFQLAHWAFHRVILQRCPIGFQRMIESQLTRIDRHQRHYFSRPVAIADVTTTDSKFLDAVEAGDCAVARDILAFHLLDTALGLIVTGDPLHQFCSLPMALEGQSISLTGLDRLRAGQQADVAWSRTPSEVVSRLGTTHLRVARRPALETSPATSVVGTALTSLLGR